MDRWARFIPRCIQRFLREEDGVEAIEWLALSVLMASIIIYFGLELVGEILGDFAAELENTTSG